MAINNVSVKSNLNMKDLDLKVSTDKSNLNIEDLDLKVINYYYANLPDKPKINDVVLSGNKTTSDLGIQEDKNFIYNQLVSASTWNITHNLDKYPSVSIVDSSGTEVYGNVIYIDKNNIKVEFNNEFAGKAYLN